MNAPSQIDSMTSAIHRLGGASGLTREDGRGLVLTGGHAAASERTMRVAHEDFLGKLNCLRYLRFVTSEQGADARAGRGSHAADCLPRLPLPDRVTPPPKLSSTT